MAIPYGNAQLAPYVTNFRDRITETPSDFGVTAAQAAALTAVADPYLEAQQAIAVPGARSPALTSQRNALRAAMMPVLRELYGLVQANLSVTDADKLLLGVTVRAAPTTIGVPTTFPAMDIVWVNGHTARVRLHDGSGEGKRSKPAGVKGAAVLSYHGPNPESLSEYKWEGNTNRSIFDVQFDESLAPGTVVYLSAMWLNERNQHGPACPAVSTNIQFGGMVARAA